MKSLISILIFVFSFTAFAKTSGYEPFKFRCVYNTTNDGMITTVSKIDPDNDVWEMTFTSSLDNIPDTAEAVSAVVYGKNDKMNLGLRKIVDRLSQILKIDQSKLFSITEVTVSKSQPLFQFYKFNSKDGTLGIGTRTLYLGNDYFEVCK